MADITMYAVVCSEETGRKWKKALKSLEQKYQLKWSLNKVKTILYSEDVTSCLSQLCEYRPAYTCFLTHYEECTSSFVVQVHCLTRQIDPNTPFTDTIWGILTGLTEEDVLFAIAQDSLTVRRVLGGTPVNLSKFESGSWYSEWEACVMYNKDIHEASARKETCPRDTTAVLVKELSCERDIEKGIGVDMMVTSGHATEKDWNIGYSYRNGRFICQSSNMVGEAMDGSTHPITFNDKPKILSAAGNCLVGNISERNCMALAWMHSVGVVQMTGYLVPTWFGFGGWGVHNYFIDSPGLLSFAESFFANHQALLAELHTKYSQHETKSYEEYSGAIKECSGLLHDRDVVAFYGDPAWEAKILEKPDEHAYTLSVSELPQDEPEWKKYELKVTIKSNFGRPPIYIFPHTMRRYKILSGDAILTCRFILITGSCEPGKEHNIVYAVQ